MSDAELSDVVEARELWSIGVRLAEGAPWVEFGTPSVDVASILRTYDYKTENEPDTEVCILRTVVVITKADIELLREKVERASASETGADVQSE